MIYITEQNLRDLYCKQAFESFTLAEGERLTPGGRQFLADRQIAVIDPRDIKPLKTASISAMAQAPKMDFMTIPKAEPPAAKTDVAPAASPVIPAVADRETMNAGFCALQSLYMKEAAAMYSKNQILANEIFDMEASLESIKTGAADNILVPGVCGGMNEQQLKCPQTECFHMTRAILLANHGTEAAVLHYLRSETFRFYCEYAQTLQDKQKVQISYLINLFSQMIHKTIGGSLCQKVHK